MIFVKKIGICFGDVFFQTEVYTFLGNVYNLAFLQEDKEKFSQRINHRLGIFDIVCAGCIPERPRVVLAGCAAELLIDADLHLVRL